MKKLITLLLIIPTLSNAKFASWVMEIPCDKMTLKVTSCKEFEFSNKKKLSAKELKTRKELVIERKGSIVSGKIEKVEPMKCHAKQKMDLKRFKKREFKIKKFFVSRLKCKKSLKSVIVKRPNFFCDTPGAHRIVDCFIPERSRKEIFVYTELIK
jgi:hypothetical protein